MEVSHEVGYADGGYLGEEPTEWEEGGKEVYGVGLTRTHVPDVFWLCKEFGQTRGIPVREGLVGRKVEDKECFLRKKSARS